MTDALFDSSGGAPALAGNPPSAPPEPAPGAASLHPESAAPGPHVGPVVQAGAKATGPAPAEQRLIINVAYAVCAYHDSYINKPCPSCLAVVRDAVLALAAVTT